MRVMMSLPADPCGLAGCRIRTANSKKFNTNMLIEISARLSGILDYHFFLFADLLPPPSSSLAAANACSSPKSKQDAEAIRCNASKQS